MPKHSAKPRHPAPPAPWNRDLPEVVDPQWILRAGAVTIAAALLCAWALFCVVFSITQWQYVLKPSHEIAQTPASLGLAFTEVHFGVDASGQPQLDGWWIPSDLPTDPTVILLHSGSGAMSDALPQAQALHDVRLNVLLFDYRGFGHSLGAHPTQALMQADADSALNYLTTTRAIPAGNVLVYGNGVGASLAAALCAQHPQLAGLILESPSGDLTPLVLADPRTRLVPVRLLFHEDFPLAAPLAKLQTPKLIVTYNATSNAVDRNQIADPKMTVELPSPADTSDLHAALRRFLDTYVAHPPSSLNPVP